jgi:hypothetical protein
LHHLFATYGSITREDLSNNEIAMTTPWDINTPIEVLWNQLNTGRNFAADHDPYSDQRMIRFAIDLIRASGVLTKAIDTFDKRPVVEKTWENLQLDVNTDNKIRLAETTSAQGGYHGANATKEVAPTPPTFSGMSYCCTHGLGHQIEHTSATCRSQAPGHEVKATTNNMMGGNNIIARKRGEQPKYVRPLRRNPSAQRTPSAQIKQE